MANSIPKITMQFWFREFERPKHIFYLQLGSMFTYSYLNINSFSTKDFFIKDSSVNNDISKFPSICMYGLAACWRQSILKTNADYMPFRTWGTILSEIFSKFECFPWRHCMWNYWLRYRARYLLALMCWYKYALDPVIPCVFIFVGNRQKVICRLFH